MVIGIENISSRIEAIMLYYNLNKNSLSKKLNISNNVTIGRIINSERKPSFEILSKLCTAFPDLNGRWLLTGEGEMLSNSYKYNVKEFISYAKENNDKLLLESEYKLLIERNLSILELEEEKEKLNSEVEKIREIINKSKSKNSSTN